MHQIEETIATNYKLIKTGKILEFYVSQKPFIEADSENNDVERRIFISDSNSDNDIYRSDEYARRSAQTARNKIRRLGQTNFTGRAIFITLTFADTKKFDITDPKQCNQRFNDFIRKLKQETKVSLLTEFKWISVMEFQKRGAVHYHMICNIPYIDQKSLLKLWGHGFVGINRLKHTKRVGVYISKYISKDLYKREKSETFRKFFCSRSLDQPKVYYGDKVKILFERLKNSGYIPNFKSSYPSEFNGIIRYYEFDFLEDT